MSYQFAMWFTLAMQLITFVSFLLLHARANKYRRLWIDRTKELIEARAERDEQTKTAWGCNEARSQSDIARAKLRRQVTIQAEQIDSLMNGEAVCVFGHRHYKTQGDKCPHCGARDNIKASDSWLVCKICLKPIEGEVSKDGVCPQCADIATRF